MVEQAQCGEQWVIYNRIRDLRRSRGITQNELARDLELNVRTVGYIERQDYWVVFGLALAPADSAAVTVSVIWIVGALVLLGLWIATAIEVLKRFFSSGDRRQSEG